MLFYIHDSAILAAGAVLALAVQVPVLVVFPLLVMLWMLVRVMQLLVVLVMQLLGYRKQTLPSRCPAVCVFWCSFQRSRDFFKQATVLFPGI